MKSLILVLLSLVTTEVFAAPYLVYRPARARFVESFEGSGLRRMNLSTGQAFELQRQGFLVEPEKPVQFQQKIQAPSPRRQFQEGNDVVWPLESMRTNEAHRQSGSFGQGVTVCLVDSGVNVRHPSLRGAVVGGLNVADSSRAEDINDEVGHGTQVATLMVGRQVNQHIGVAPAASLYVVKIADRRNPAFLGNLIEGVRSCFGKAQIINLSVGSDQPSAILNDVVMEAYSKGITVVMATVSSPRESLVQPSDPYIITVGAINQDRKVSIFSGRGKSLDLVAPGEDVPVLNADGRSVSIVSGTSYAAGMVSGVEALRRARGAKFLLTSDLGLSPMEQGRGLVDALATVMSR